MPCLNDPFSPIPSDMLFNKLSESENYLEKMIEKINQFITTNSEKSKNIPGSAITAAIFSAYDSVSNNTGISKIIIFSANKCSPGKFSYDEHEFNKFYNSDGEIKAFLQQVKKLILA